MSRIAQILALEMTAVEKAALVKVAESEINSSDVNLTTLSNLRLIEQSPESGSVRLTKLGLQVLQRL